MCGIAGYISLDNAVSADQLKAATTSLSHRGPDAEHLYISEDGKVGFGHRRLAILDLRETADQPMISSDGRYVIVFNGEVYNFNLLKNHLADKGRSLRTTSDTEVVLELFAQKGAGAFELLNGMFAFAIFDKFAKKVTFCRDHSGIKPLFIHCSEKQIAFASELKALKKMQAEKFCINKEAIPYFLHLGFIPAPQTIYKGVYKFPSAHFLEVDLCSGNLAKALDNVVSFWKLENTIKPEQHQDEVSSKHILKSLLLDSVEEQMVSDVPVGTFLSGGIDSSLVTALASEVNPRKIESFSIAIDNGKYNEGVYAKQVSKHLHTHHHQFNIAEDEVIELIDKLMPAFDEPFADSSAFPTMMVSRLAREHVTVALSGDGGDELFMGYGMHKWAKRLDTPVVSLSRKPIAMASKMMNDRYQRIGKMFEWPDEQRKLTHIFSQEQYMFSESDLKDVLINNSVSFVNINKTLATARPLEAAEKQSLWDFNHYLQDDLLVKVDRASMQYSLETRVPILDRRIIEFAFNLEPELKIRQGNMKYLLKEVLYDFVPRQLFDRPKWGFTIPLAKWMKTDLRFLLDKYCNEELITRFNVVSWSMVEKIRSRYLKGSDHLYNRLWLIVVLHWWLAENE
jgi:asparagine synthase (glutamine-hydrolysing)